MTTPDERGFVKCRIEIAFHSESSSAHESRWGCSSPDESKQSLEMVLVECLSSLYSFADAAAILARCIWHADEMDERDFRTPEQREAYESLVASAKTFAKTMEPDVSSDLAGE